MNPLVRRTRVSYATLGARRGLITEAQLHEFAERFGARDGVVLMSWDEEGVSLWYRVAAAQVPIQG